MQRFRFEEIHLGQSAEFEVRITPAMMDQFMALSGDSNPMHTDVAAAREAGYSDRLVYGMLSASFFSTLVGMHLPGERAILQGIELSFRNAIHPGETVRVHGEVAYIQEALRQLELKGSIRDLQGRLLVKANIKVGVRADRN